MRASIVELGGPEPKLDDLIQIFKDSPPALMIHALSSLSIISGQQSIQKVDKFLRENILSTDEKRLLNEFELSQKPRPIVYSDMTLLFLFDLCRQFSNIENHENIPAHEMSRRLSKAFLIANYFVSKANLQHEGQSREKYARFAMREGIFNDNDQFRYMLGRSKLVFDRLRECVEPKSKQFNVSDFFEEKCQFSLDDYFKCIVALHAHFNQFSSNSPISKPVFISPETFFSQASNSERVKNVLDYLTQEWGVPDSFKLFDESDQNSMREYFYRHFRAKAKPLVKLESKIYPISLKFIDQLCWEGPYYLSIDEMNRANIPREPLFHFLGETTEIYAKRLLKYSFPKNYLIQSTQFQNPLGDCTLRINPKFHVVFEIKAKRPLLDAISGDTPLNQNKSVKLMFIEPMTQLSRRIMEFRNEYNGLITPVLITMGSLNINEISWSEYFEVVKHLPIFADKKITSPIFLDAETLEILCALGQSKHSLSKIIRGKLQDRWKISDFKSYLFEGYFSGKQSIEPINVPVADATTEVFNDLSEELFGTSIQKKLSNWRSVFGVGAE